MSKHTEISRRNRWSLGAYFKSLTRLLGSPRQFFRELPEELGFRRPFEFLLTSSLFFAGASLIGIRDHPLVLGGIFLLNALAMPAIMAGIASMVMIMTMRRRAAFSRVFAVYAFSSGATMLASWIPLLVWFTEPWKWVLVTIGMVNACGFGWLQAILVNGLSVLIVVLFFCSLGPVVCHV